MEHNLGKKKERKRRVKKKVGWDWFNTQWHAKITNIKYIYNKFEDETERRNKGTLDCDTTTQDHSTITSTFSFIMIIFFLYIYIMYSFLPIMIRCNLI